MPLTVSFQNILNTSADAIVVSAKPSVEIGPGLDGKIYTLAGKDALLAERKNIGKIHKGNAVITPGFSSGFKYIIHTVVPTWHAGWANESRYLTNCYQNALSLAEKNNITRIAFPLLGARRNHIPVPAAIEIAEYAIKEWLHSHSSDMQVLLVLHPDIRAEVAAKATSGTVLAALPSPEEIFRDYLLKRIPSQAAVSRMIKYSESSLSRLIKGEIAFPHRNVVLSLAIAMKLSEKERTEFINSGGYSYPSLPKDHALEAILSEGYTDFDFINNELIKQDTSWDLLHRTK